MRENCYICMRPKVGCLCKHLSPIQTNTLFVILIHPMEYKKEKNGTGILTHLQLHNSKLIMGVNFTENSQVNTLIKSPENDCYLLYPGEESKNLSDEHSLEIDSRQKVIFILDGTWPCAKKMLKLSTNLRSLPKISFRNSKPSKFILKQQPNKLCLSTIESTKILLSELNRLKVESCSIGSFLKPFEKLIDFQVNCILNPPSHSYRSRGNGKIKEKNMYKKPNGRKLFFEEKEIKKHHFS